MKANIKLKQYLVPLIGLVLILFLVQCSKNVGPIDRDDLILPDGDRALVIKTVNSNTAGEALGTYQLEIVSPSGTETVSLTTETHTLTTLVNGLYTITSLKDGFKGQTVEFNVVLPADHTSDYSAALELKLTKLTPPVVIDTETGGEVEAPPIGDTDSGTGSNAATVTIPPNVVTAPVGSVVSFSFTQLPPTTTSTNASGLKTAAAFGTATSSIELNYFVDGVLTYLDISPNTFPVVMDLGFSAAMISKGITARLYAVDDNGTLTDDYVDLSQRNDGKWEAQISHTGEWQVVEGWKAIFSTGTYAKNYTSGCSEALNKSFSYSKGYGPEYTSRKHITNQTVTVTTNITAAAALWYTRTATITVPTRNYVMRITGGSEIESVNGIPESALSYTIAFSASDCHDSGGHDSGGN